MCSPALNLLYVPVMIIFAISGTSSTILLLPGICPLVPLKYKIGTWVEKNFRAKHAQAWMVTSWEERPQGEKISRVKGAQAWAIQG